MRAFFVSAALLVLAVAPLPAAAASRQAVPEGLWVTRHEEVFRLDPGQSLQFRVDFSDIPVRRWKLTVDGDQRTCDLNVLNLSDGSLLYQKSRESRHSVMIPWGRGESLMVTLTAGLSSGGVFTVKFVGPPRDKARRAYGPRLNRALEAIESGDSRRAEAILHDVARGGEDSGVAALLLAGLLKQRGDLEQAAAMMQYALSQPLPDELVDVRRELARQLATVREPRPPELAQADSLLAAGDSLSAVAELKSFLADHPAPERGTAPCEAWRRLAKIQAARGERVAALQSYDAAVRAAPDPGMRALVTFDLARLQESLHNPVQAVAALREAQRLGLPPDLDREAAETIARLEPHRGE